MGARTRGLANNVLTSGKLDATDAVSGVIPASNIANASLTSATSFGSATGGVPQVASDPPSPTEGDIWYNTTSGQIKFVAQAGTWASGGNLNTARYYLGSANAGTQTEALAFGGTTPPYSAVTEEYNGSTWTNSTNLSTARYALAGAGIQTAALAFGGTTTTPTSATEEYNGSSWTSGGSMGTGRGDLGGCGT